MTVGRCLLMVNGDSFTVCKLAKQRW